MEIDGLTEQRIIITFLVKLGYTYLQIHQMLSAVYGDDALKKIALFKWIKRFQEGSEDCKDDMRPGRPSTTCNNLNVDHVQSLVLSD